MAKQETMFVLSDKLNMCLILWFPSEGAVLGRGAWLAYEGAPCSSWRRGSWGTVAAGSPGPALAALCTAGKNSLLSALASVKESQGEQRREGLD